MPAGIVRRVFEPSGEDIGITLDADRGRIAKRRP